MATRLTSREFNQDTGRAKRAAESGPVYITDRGRPSHVLLSFEEYCRLAGAQPGIIELLGEPAGVETVDFEAPVEREAPRPAPFD
ncbi:MAG: type II toxin-antitoxin system prevent-host-death family antitoxin [Acidimicrobiales bacterium]